jgi:pilus assembly protein CpaE
MRTFVLSDNEPVTISIREILTRNVIDCPTSQVLLLHLAANHSALAQAELIIVVLSPDPTRALDVLRQVRQTTQAHILAVGPADDSKLILRTLRDGANEYVDETELQTELEVAINRLGTKVFGQAVRGRMIAVLGPSGGSGSSTVAANIATALAKQHSSAALFDLKLEAGDLAPLLDLKPTHTLADLCRNLARVDRSMFEQLLTRHSSGVHLLAAPQKFADVSHVLPKGVHQGLTMALAMFPYVVADLDHSFREEQTEALRQADIILLVFRLDFTSLRNARKTYEHLVDIGIDRQRVRLVVNRYGQPKELPASSAEQALGVKVFHYIPDDPKTINRANNKGIPVVLESPKARVSRSITQIAMSVNGQAHKE